MFGQSNVPKETETCLYDTCLPNCIRLSVHINSKFNCAKEHTNFQLCPYATAIQEFTNLSQLFLNTKVLKKYHFSNADPDLRENNVGLTEKARIDGFAYTYSLSPL